MDSPEFISLVYNNIYYYLFSLFIVSLSYTILLRKYYISFFDPAFISFFFSVFAGATVVFLYVTNEIKEHYFFLYLITQSAFLVGFLIFKPININYFSVKQDSNLNPDQVRLIKWLFLLSLTIVVISQILSYYAKGIPLLSDSRLDIYVELDRFKFVKKFIEAFFPLLCLLTGYFLLNKDQPIYIVILSRLSLIAILIFSILSGGKSSFLFVVSTFFVFSIYSAKNGNFELIKKFKKYQVWLFATAILVAMTVVIYGENASAFYFLIYRMAITGDIFYMTFPNEIIENLPRINIFNAIFSSPLQMLGYLNPEDVQEPIGYTVMKIHNPSIAYRGPNPRMNFFGYIEFGYLGAIIFAFLNGYIFGFVRNKLFYILPSNIIGCIFYFYLLKFAVALETDFILSIGNLINLLVLLLPFIFASYLLADNSKRDNTI